MARDAGAPGGRVDRPVEGLAEVASIAICTGAVLAAGAGDRRFAVLGLTVALLAAPLVATPWPAPLPLAFREVAVLIGTYLLWVAARRESTHALQAETRVVAAVFVVAAFVAAVALAPSLGPGRGPAGAFASAAAAAIAGLALGAGASHALAPGLSAVFLLLSASLAFAALTGAAGPLEHAVIGAALLAVTAAAALVPSGEPPHAR